MQPAVEGLRSFHSSPGFLDSPLLSERVLLILEPRLVLFLRIDAEVALHAVMTEAAKLCASDFSRDIVARCGPP